MLSADPSLHIRPGAEPYEFGTGSEAILLIHGWSSSPRDLRFLAEKLSSYSLSDQVSNNHHGQSLQNVQNLHLLQEK